MRKKWIKEAVAVNQQVLDELAFTLGCPPVIAKLLVLHGIDTPEKAEVFFNPSIEDLHDPFLFKDMNKAVKAMNAKKWAGALKHLDRVISQDSTNAQAHYYRALCKHQIAMSRLDGGKGLKRDNIGAFISSFEDILGDLDRAERHCSYSDHDLASSISNLGYATENILSQLRSIGS